MRIPKKIKIIALIVSGGFIAFLFLESVGVFDDRPYQVVPHGNHNHYVPHDRDPDIPIDAFPTEPPGEGERITPYGTIVRD